MKAYTRRRLIASVKLGAAAVPFVVIIRALTGGFIPGAIVLGFGLGFAVGVAELIVLRRWLRRLPFALHILVKSLALLCVLGVAYAVLNTLDVFIKGDTWSEYANNVFQPATVVGLGEMLVVIALLLFFVQLDRLLGPGVLLGYLFGRYHHPRREQRIFMFLDLKGSTALADEMNAERYFEFLHRYFTEMSEAILATDAEIYQYVGDEVVLSWKRRTGLAEANCLRVFFLIKDHLLSERERFLREFGRAPAFRAGVHGGEVITAQIGELKKEIVYNGDVLNTASRIQAKCAELGHELLVSAAIIDALQPDAQFSLHALGPVALKGKAEPIELYAVDRASRANERTVTVHESLR